MLILPIGRIREKYFNLGTPYGHRIICISINQGFYKTLHKLYCLQTPKKTPCLMSKARLRDDPKYFMIWKLIEFQMILRLDFSLHCWWQGAGYYFPPVEKTKQKKRSNLSLLAGRTCPFPWCQSLACTASKICPTVRLQKRLRMSTDILLN